MVLDLVAPSAGLPPFGAVDLVLFRTLNQITFSRFLSNWQLIGNYCEAGYPLITMLLLINDTPFGAVGFYFVFL